MAVQSVQMICSSADTRVSNHLSKMCSPTVQAGTSELVTKDSLYSPQDALWTSKVGHMNHTSETKSLTLHRVETKDD